MIYITPRQAELLSYLNGRQPMGVYFAASRLEMAADLGLSQSSVSQHLKQLDDKGCIERSGNFLRVLKRVEDRDVIEGSPPINQPITAPKQRRKLIPYAGFDPHEMRR